MSLISKEHLSLTLQAIKNLLSKKADKSELEEEISKVSKNIVQSDWNQNDETTLDYIKNRTHYTENIYELLREGEFKERGSVYAFDIMKPLGRNIVYRITLGDKYCYDAYGQESDEYSCTLSLVPYEGHHGLTLYYEECSEVNNDMLFINKEVLENAGLDSYYIKIETKIDENVYQLDEKYIPDTIARVSDVVVADWNQSDENAADFVKNRTHYIEINERVLLEKISFTTEATNEGRDYEWSQPTSEVLKNLQVGEICHVYFNGIKYSLPVKNHFAFGKYLGSSDIHSSFANRPDSDEPFCIVLGSGGGILCVYTKEASDIILKITQGESDIIHQLDEKFIPDTIARVEDIPSVNRYATKEYVDDSISAVAQDTFGAVFYESLAQAVADINNGVNDNAIQDSSIAKVKVFTADNGALTVMLLDDISTTEKIRINKNIILVLNGKVLTFTDNLSAYLMLGRDTSCYIDGTVSGSAINKSVIVAAGASTGKTYPIILSGKSLTINGGSYNTSGSFYSEHIVTIGSYGENSSLLLENCSISVTDKDSIAPSYISGLNLDAAVESAILKNVTINIDTANGKAIAIDAGNPKLKLEVYNSRLNAITRPKWATNASANGIFMSSGLLKIKDSVIHTDARNDNAAENYPLAIGLWLTGCKAFLENTNVTGTHSGVQFGDGSTEGEELYVNGGILKSYSHGGIYATGGSKVCVRDAVLRCGDYDGIFDYTSDEVFESGYLVKPFANLYVAGDGTTVYLDGCTLDSDESRWGFVAKNGTNIVINISNSTVTEGTEQIRLDDESFRANVGVGTNLTSDSFFSSHLVNFTNDIYRKLHKDEVCNGADYNAYITFLNYKNENTNSYILTSSTKGSTKKFKITIDDDGVLTATEIVESEA